MSATRSAWGEAHRVEDLAFEGVAEAGDDFLIEEGGGDGAAGVLAEAVRGRRRRSRCWRGGSGAEGFHLGVIADGIGADDEEDGMAAKEGDEWFGVWSGARVAALVEVDGHEGFAAAAFWVGRFAEGVVEEIGGRFDGPFGAGDELAHPGDAVGEVEKHPLAVGADALDDLTDAVEEEDVGLPAVLGDEDAFNGSAGEEFVEMVCESAGLGAFHGERV